MQPLEAMNSYHHHHIGNSGYPAAVQTMPSVGGGAVYLPPGSGGHIYHPQQPQQQQQHYQQHHNYPGNTSTSSGGYPPVGYGNAGTPGQHPMYTQHQLPEAYASHQPQRQQRYYPSAHVQHPQLQRQLQHPAQLPHQHHLHQQQQHRLSSQQQHHMMPSGIDYSGQQNGQPQPNWMDSHRNVAQLPQQQQRHQSQILPSGTSVNWDSVMTSSSVGPNDPANIYCNSGGNISTQPSSHLPSTGQTGQMQQHRNQPINEGYYSNLATSNWPDGSPDKAISRQQPQSMLPCYQGQAGPGVEMMLGTSAASKGGVSTMHNSVFGVGGNKGQQRGGLMHHMKCGDLPPSIDSPQSCQHNMLANRCLPQNGGSFPGQPAQDLDSLLLAKKQSMQQQLPQHNNRPINRQSTSQLPTKTKAEIRRLHHLYGSKPDLAPKVRELLVECIGPESFSIACQRFEERRPTPHSSSHLHHSSQGLQSGRSLGSGSGVLLDTEQPPPPPGYHSSTTVCSSVLGHSASNQPTGWGAAVADGTAERCSVVQSPEEGPGSSPQEEIVQSTTNAEEDQLRLGCESSNLWRHSSAGGIHSTFPTKQSKRPDSTGDNNSSCVLEALLSEVEVGHNPEVSKWPPHGGPGSVGELSRPVGGDETPLSNFYRSCRSVGNTPLEDSHGLIATPPSPDGRLPVKKQPEEGDWSPVEVVTDKSSSVQKGSTPLYNAGQQQTSTANSLIIKLLYDNSDFKKSPLCESNRVSSSQGDKKLLPKPVASSSSSNSGTSALTQLLTMSVPPTTSRSQQRTGEEGGVQRSFRDYSTNKKLDSGVFDFADQCQDSGPHLLRSNQSSAVKRASSVDSLISGSPTSKRYLPSSSCSRFVHGGAGGPQLSSLTEMLHVSTSSSSPPNSTTSSDAVVDNNRILAHLLSDGIHDDNIHDNNPAANFTSTVATAASSIEGVTQLNSEAFRRPNEKMRINPSPLTPTNRSSNTPAFSDMLKDSSAITSSSGRYKLEDMDDFSSVDFTALTDFDFDALLDSNSNDVTSADGIKTGVSTMQRLDAGGPESREAMATGAGNSSHDDDLDLFDIQKLLETGDEVDDAMLLNDILLSDKNVAGNAGQLMGDPSFAPKFSSQMSSSTGNRNQNCIVPPPASWNMTQHNSLRNMTLQKQRVQQCPISGNPTSKEPSGTTTASTLPLTSTPNTGTMSPSPTQYIQDFAERMKEVAPNVTVPVNPVVNRLHRPPATSVVAASVVSSSAVGPPLSTNLPIQGQQPQLQASMPPSRQHSTMEQQQFNSHLIKAELRQMVTNRSSGASSGHRGGVNGLPGRYNNSGSHPPPGHYQHHTAGNNNNNNNFISSSGALAKHLNHQQHGTGYPPIQHDNTASNLQNSWPQLQQQDPYESTLPDDLADTLLDFENLIYMPQPSNSPGSGTGACVGVGGGGNIPNRQYQPYSFVSGHPPTEQNMES